MHLTYPSPASESTCNSETNLEHMQKRNTVLINNMSAFPSLVSRCWSFPKNHRRHCSRGCPRLTSFSEYIFLNYFVKSSKKKKKKHFIV